MPDDSLEILIKFGLDKTKATEALGEIEKLKTATDKTTVSKKQLKDMVKGLATEFPLLGHVAHLALNPLALLTASIAGGFALWTRRVNELTVALGGVEMPDVKESDADRIAKQAAAWGTLAEKMAAAATSSKQIHDRYAATIKLIEANDKFAQALGIDTGGQPTQDKAIATARTADALERDARARLARAGTPGSVAGEDSAAKKFGDAVVAASAAKKETQGRIDDILQVQTEFGATGGMGPGGLSVGGLLAFIRNWFRYGTAMGGAGELEDQNLAGQQGIIDRGQSFARSAASRAVRRGEITAANADLSEVARLRAEVQELRQQSATIQARQAAALFERAGSGLSGNISGVGPAASQLIQGAMLLIKAAQTMSDADARTQNAIKTVRDQQ